MKFDMSMKEGQLLKLYHNTASQNVQEKLSSGISGSLPLEGRGGLEFIVLVCAQKRKSCNTSALNPMISLYSPHSPHYVKTIVENPERPSGDV